MTTIRSYYDGDHFDIDDVDDDEELDPENAQYCKLIMNRKASDYHLKIEPEYDGRYINSHLMLSREDHSPYSGRCLLSEFPGNCSSLILSGIQSKLQSRDEKMFDDVVNFTISICELFKYGALVITGTSPELSQALEIIWDFKKEISGLYNPHSDNINFFMVKRFGQPERNST
jgi:hypothetical protein